MNNVDHLSQLTTEAIDPELSEIDTLGTLERLRLINREDARVASAIEGELGSVARAVARIVHSMRSGGRLLYVGAGTSGRLGVLDASECPPTFGTPPSLVQGIIAGGATALTNAVEGVEDDVQAGFAAMVECDVNSHDTVVGISASGRTPFVLGALHHAKTRGASTVAVVNNRPSAAEEIAAVTIAVVVGPEVLSGSTRLKAGTAQKMVLNMLSTGSMFELGKTYGNLMVDVQATNEKLRSRAIRIVTEVTGASVERATKALADASNSAKLAILLVETGLTADEGRVLLARHGGILEESARRQDQALAPSDPYRVAAGCSPHVVVLFLWLVIVRQAPVFEARSLRLHQNLSSEPLR